jgi:hypothetical protein
VQPALLVLKVFREHQALLVLLVLVYKVIQVLLVQLEQPVLLVLLDRKVLLDRVLLAQPEQQVLLDRKVLLDFKVNLLQVLVVLQVLPDQQAELVLPGLTVELVLLDRQEFQRHKAELVLLDI